MSNIHENKQGNAGQDFSAQKTLSRRKFLTALGGGAAGAAFLAACGGEAGILSKESKFDIAAKEEEFRIARNDLQQQMNDFGDKSYVVNFMPFYQEEIEKHLPLWTKLKANNQLPEFALFHPRFTAENGTYILPDGSTPVANATNVSIGHYSDELFQKILSQTADLKVWKSSKEIVNDSKNELDEVNFVFHNVSNLAIENSNAVRFIYAYTHNPIDNMWYQMWSESGAKIRDTENKFETSLLVFKTSKRYGMTPETSNKVLSGINDKMALVVTDFIGHPISKTVVDQDHHI